jgi:hypothetical protein
MSFYEIFWPFLNIKRIDFSLTMVGDGTQLAVLKTYAIKT